jgi:four helix bundle protein
MTPQQLRERTMAFAVRTVTFCRNIQGAWEGRQVGGQLIDSATSMAMNYRATNRARTRREFIAKLGIVVEEADETVGWLELIARTNLAGGEELDWLLKEARELVAIFAASHRTAKANHVEAAHARVTGSSNAR